MFITKEILISKGACRDQLTTFRRHFPAGIEITEAVAEKYASLFDIDWLVEYFLPPPQWAQYQQTKARPWARYIKAIAVLWAECEDGKVARRAEFNRRAALLRTQYNQTMGLWFVRLSNGS